MYGTIMRARLKKDHVRDFLALGKEWDARERRRAVGFSGSQILWEKEPGRFALLVRFVDEESYRKNAASPEQDAFYRRMRECLEEDPEWIDGDWASWDAYDARPPRWATS
jgi:antibiotic biosynthesis monooxygenase (ABM) superfamily enzyme